MTPHKARPHQRHRIPDLSLDNRREVIKEAFDDLRRMVDTPIYALMIEDLKKVKQRVPRPNLTLGIASLERI